MFSARRASPSAARAISASASLLGLDRRAAASLVARSARSSTLRRSLLGQSAQHVNARARQQRVVELERRVLGGRADEHERAVLDPRQKCVLLRLVEAMHLVEEQHGAPPDSCARCCARSAAARMSLTPAITADNAMNSASQVCATSRASVVLPVPGGPQRIIECRCPPSSMRRSGLPAPSRCAWPTYSSSASGRMRSASGRSRSLQLRVLTPSGPCLDALRPAAEPRERQHESADDAQAVGDTSVRSAWRPTCIAPCSALDHDAHDEQAYADHRIARAADRSPRTRATGPHSRSRAPVCR